MTRANLQPGFSAETKANGSSSSTVPAASFIRKSWNRARRRARRAPSGSLRRSRSRPFPRCRAWKADTLPAPPPRISRRLRRSVGEKIRGMRGVAAIGADHERMPCAGVGHGFIGIEVAPAWLDQPLAAGEIAEIAAAALYGGSRAPLALAFLLLVPLGVGDHRVRLPLPSKRRLRRRARESLSERCRQGRGRAL